MNILRSIIILILLLSTFAWAGKKANSNEWNGKYEYEDAVLGDPHPIIVTYELNIQGDSCRLKLDGFQTYERIICSVEENNNTLNIMFVSYDNGKVENAHGVKVYSPGDVFFAFRKENNEKIITTWGTMHEDLIIERAKSGVYFKKIK